MSNPPPVVNSPSDYNDWLIPEFDADSGNNKPQIRKGLPTAEELEGIYSQAQKEGFEKGYLEGQSHGVHDLETKLHSLTELIDVMTQPYDNLSNDVIESIKQLAVIIASHIVRREISQDETTVIAAVKKSIELLKNVKHDVSLHLNPDDVEIVKGMLSVNELGKLELIADITIVRGGCRLESDISTIDATVESQLKELATEIMGGTRRDDN